MASTAILYCHFYSPAPAPAQYIQFRHPQFRHRPITAKSTTPSLAPPPPSSSSSSSSSSSRITATSFAVRFLGRKTRRPTRDLALAVMLHQNAVVSDLIASGLSIVIALSILRLFEETAKRHIFDQRRTLSPVATMLVSSAVFFDLLATVVCTGVVFALLELWKVTAKHGLDQKLNRKLVHISIGLAFMLCWPLYSSDRRGAILAALIPGINIIRMLLVGSGILKDEATVKSMSRFGDRRELLKGPLYYATTITLAGAVYWRTSPIAIATICNLCAGDGIADIVGRRFGSQKLPYNRNKSVAGSVSMALAGFLASVGYMYYFESFGYLQKSWEMVLGFFVVSLAAAFVESLPISTELDDNLTVTLTSILFGSLVF